MIRVAVTTSADRQERVGGLMRTVGLQPVALPCIEIRTAEPSILDAARRAAEQADAIVLTSARTVSVLWENRMPSTPVWAVGPATAAAVRRRNGRVVHVGSTGAAALADQVAPGSEAVVAYPHAAGSDERVGERLAARVDRVVEHIVYAAEPVVPGDDAVDAIAFLSPSAVIGWMGRRSTDGLVVGAIGNTTAQALRDHGVQPDVVPPSPDLVRMARGIFAAASNQIPSTPE